MVSSSFGAAATQRVPARGCGSYPPSGTEAVVQNLVLAVHQPERPHSRVEMTGAIGSPSPASQSTWYSSGDAQTQNS